MATLSILLLTIMNIQNPDPAVYTYADGSANLYRMSADTFEYIPVTKEQSSTGIYDGGAPVKKAMRAVFFAEFTGLIERAKIENGQHAADRAKMTGQIGIQKGKETLGFILKSDSEIKKRIEKLLEEEKRIK